MQRVDDALDARVVGRDAVADQPVGRGQRLEQVDRDARRRPRRHGVREDVAGVDAGGAGADDRDAEGLEGRGFGHSGSAFRWVCCAVGVGSQARGGERFERDARGAITASSAGRRGSGATTSPTTTTAGERMPRSAACAAIVPSVPTVTRWRGPKPSSTIATGQSRAALAAGEGDRRVRERADAHEQHDRVVAAAAERADLVVAGDDGERRGEAAVGERDAGDRGHRDGTRDARHDLDLDAGVPAERELLAAAAEDVRIAALEPHDASCPRGRGARAGR